MKLLIKIYIPEVNPYDLTQILDVLNSSISDKENTKIHITSNDTNFEFDPYEYSYLSDLSIPKMINYNLYDLEWDIVLPIFRPCIESRGFDVIIKNFYGEKFPSLDGVLLLNDGTKNIYPVIGRKYFEKFGYIYNPAYVKNNYEEEFIEVLNQSNKSYVFDKVIFNTLILKSDDDNIYEMRKKLNFGLK